MAFNVQAYQDRLIIQIKNDTKHTILVATSDEAATKLERITTLGKQLVGINKNDIVEINAGSSMTVSQNKQPLGDNKYFTIAGKYDKTVSKPGYCKLNIEKSNAFNITFRASKLTGISCKTTGSYSSNALF